MKPGVCLIILIRVVSYPGGNGHGRVRGGQGRIVERGTKSQEPVGGLARAMLAMSGFWGWSEGWYVVPLPP